VLRAGTTLPSPSGQYVAVVGAHREVWGNYLADFALWSVASPPRLLYYRAGHAAHMLGAHQTDQPTFLCWSQLGDWLTFYEVKRQQTYQVVFVHAASSQVYRVAATDELLRQLPALSQSGSQIKIFLQQVVHSIGPLPQDAVPAELYPR
jgi:hypothetical protein